MPFRGPKRRLALAASAALLASWGATPSCGDVIERIPAVVDGRPLLLTQVQALERIRGLGGTEALEAAIDEELMYQEATRTPQANPSADEEKAALHSLVSRAGSRATGVPAPDLARLARREATILKYVDLRFRPQVRIDDEAVRRAYEAETTGTASAPPFDEVEPTIRGRLADREIDERIEGWVRELRAGADIRYNEPP
jgi:hypothetical protein